MGDVLSVEYRVYADPRHPDLWGVFRHQGDYVTVQAWRRDYDDAVIEAARMSENEYDK
jgi:hypothetical protein